MSSGNFEKIFKDLFEEYFIPLSHYALKYVKDLDTAKEIVHNVFLNLWEKREEIDVNKPLKPYLYTSTYNRCLNYIRDNKKFNKDELSISFLEQHGNHEDHDKLVEQEVQHKIDEALAQLPGKCKEIFMLNRFQSLKYSEIAEQLDVSVKTVEAQMSKALKILRKELAEYLTVLLIGMEFLKNYIG